MTYQDINDLIDRIEAGDEEAADEARELSAKLSKRANTRLRALEKEGFTSGQAYRSANYFLEEDFDRTRFSESKKLNDKDLVRNLEIVNDFLNNPTSTVGYERERRAGFEKLDLPEDMSRSGRRSLRDFLASDAWKEYKASIYIHKRGKTEAESNEATAAIQSAADAISRGASVDDLENLYREYQERTSYGEDVSLFDVFEEWEEF